MSERRSEPLRSPRYMTLHSALVLSRKQSIASQTQQSETVEIKIGLIDELKAIRATALASLVDDLAVRSSFLQIRFVFRIAKEPGEEAIEGTKSSPNDFLL